MPRDRHYRSPVLPFDYEPDGQTIWPCPDCLPWHLEVITDSVEAPVIIREWHAVGCPVFNEGDG